MRILIRHRDPGSRALLAGLPQLLRTNFDVIELAQDEPMGDSFGAEAVVAIGPVSATDIDSGNFRFIQIMGTGYEHVALDAARRKGIIVANLPARETGNAASVAELALLLTLALFRKLDAARASLHQGRLADPLGTSLLGKTALVLGLGDVGSATARLLLAFGMRVLATRRNPNAGAPNGVELRTTAQAASAAAEADVVIVAARWQPGDPPIVDQPFLRAMRPTAYLINVARAPLIDRQALHAALETGAIAGAGLDVFWQEPADPADPLLRLPNVLATPHIGGVTGLHIARSIERIDANLRAFRDGRAIQFRLEPS